MGRTVSLSAYRRLTLVTTVLGVLLFALGLIVIIQLRMGSVGGPLVLVGILLGLSTAWLRIEGQASARPRGSVVLYVRQDCALCEEARAILVPLAAQRGLDVWEVNVDSDPALAREYGEAVPAAVASGTELFRLRADPSALAARLDSVTGSRSSPRATPEPRGR